MRSFARRLAVTAALALLPVLASAETLDELLQKNLAARGGLEKMQAIKSMKVLGKQSVQGMDIPFTIIQLRPKSVRLEATVQGQTIVQAFDGSTAWTIMPLMGSKDPEKVDGDEARSLEQQGDVDGPLVDWKTKGHQLELAGKDEVDGSPAWKLKLTMKGGDVTDVFLDAESFLEIKHRTRRKVQGNEMEIENLFSNYKSEGGVLMAHSIETKFGGKTGSQITIDKVEINPAVDSKIFVMPPKSEPAKSAAPAPAKDDAKKDEGAKKKG